ncbi:unnamed protein product [Leuciscus chuanchicus]
MGRERFDRQKSLAHYIKIDILPVTVMFAEGKRGSLRLYDQTFHFTQKAMGHLAALLRAEQGINLIDSWEMVCVLMWVCASIRNPSMTQFSAFCLPPYDVHHFDGTHTSLTGLMPTSFDLSDEVIDWFLYLAPLLPSNPGPCS